MTDVPGAKPLYTIDLGDSASRRQVLHAESNQTTTVRIQGPREMTHIALAPAAFDGAAPGPGALPAVALALACVRERPEVQVLVCGHGPDEATSRGRAGELLRLLRGEGEHAAATGELARLVGLTPEDLAAVREGLTAPRAVGCGAAWPLDRVRMSGYRAPGAERVDLLLVLPGDAPELKCHAGPACDWKTCDLFRKGRYKALELVPRPPAPGKTVHVLDLALGDAFVVPDGTKKHLEPGVALAPGPDGALLEGLAALLKLAAEGPRRAVVTMHGEGGELAELRGDNARAFLEGRDAWAAHSKRHARVGDFQRLLTWAAGAKGWSCDPNGVDGLHYSGSQKALNGFRKAYQKQSGTWLQQTQSPGEADWRAFFDVLDGWVAEKAGVDTSAARAALSWLAPEAVPCGEAWPPAKVDVFEYQGVHAARLEVLLFAEADAPADVQPPLAGVYAGNAYRAVHLVPGGDAHALNVRVLDEADRPVRDQRYEVRRGEEVVREGTLGADGAVACALAAGTYEVRVLKPAAPEAAPQDEPPAWEGGAGSLDELLRGDYQRRGSYRDDMSGFKNADLQRFLEEACAQAGVDPKELSQGGAAATGGGGHMEAAGQAGLPTWVLALQSAAITSTTWGVQEQIQSRLVGAFFYAHFVERLYAPRGLTMPANVEYFLEHLGKSYTNGAADEEVGAMGTKFNYCASASSKAYLEGLRRYGWGTSALGYAPGKPPKQGHGCQVGFSQGRLAGAEHVPQPGDVLSVQTFMSPDTGHVVTVALCEGDGTKTGGMWSVSGNAMHGSVACSYSTLADVSGKPPPGHCRVINRSFNHELQPHALAALDPAELEERGVQRLDGDFPRPNEPGRLAPARPPQDAGPLALLAQGEAPTAPVSAPGEPTILRAGLKVVRFQGRALVDPAVGVAPAPPSERVLVQPGCPLRLEWLVQDCDRLVLQPCNLDLTQLTLAGTPTLDLLPAEDPPDERGVYRLEATSGGRTATAELTVLGIADLRVTGRAQPGKKPPELLQRQMKGKHFGTPFYDAADSVGAFPGAFQRLTKASSEDYQYWFWGQITPKSNTLLSWKVIGPPDARVLLTVNRKVNSIQPNPPQDVTAACRREGGLLVGEHEHASDAKYRTFYEADLQLLDGAGAELAAAVIRLRENYEMPGIDDFAMVVDGQTIRDDGAQVQRGSQPSFTWRLKGSHKKNGLEVRLAGLDGRHVAQQTIRDWVRDGQPVPPENDQSAGSATLAEPIPKEGYTLECEARLQLFTRFGCSGKKSIKFTLVGSGPAPGASGGKEVRIRLFDEAARAMADCPFEVVEGTQLVKEGRSDAEGFLSLTGAKLPEKVLVRWGPGLPHRTVLQLDFSKLDETEQAKLRLQNLGYHQSLGLKRQVTLFQQQNGLAPTGQLDAATKHKLFTMHDECKEKP